MRLTNRTRLLITLLFTPSLLNAAASEDRGWSWSQSFHGTSNSAGIILKSNSTATYDFNRAVAVYAGVPIYFARTNGIGNAYSGLLVSAGKSSSLRYSSDLLFTMPTGNAAGGFSTGHPTVDWTNTFSHSFTRVTPFASIGAANTISDTSFFVRPFSSKGVIAHFEAGSVIDVAPRVSIGASGYGVQATGQQEIISKVVEQPSKSSQPAVLSTVDNLVHGKNRAPAVFETQQQTVGPASVANDRGLSTWLTVRATPSTDFQIGYSRSIAYHLDSLFFGVGFHIGHRSSVIN